MYPFQGIVTQSTNTDLAILKFLATEAPYLKLGQSIHSVEGQKVLVIGNPEGLLQFRTGFFGVSPKSILHSNYGADFAWVQWLACARRKW
jgi:hypothetical protein